VQSGWQALTMTSFNRMKLSPVVAGSTCDGNGVVRYSVDAYSGKKTRTGTLTIAGHIFSVTEAHK
jgi:hypothetical protein